MCAHAQTHTHTHTHTDVSLWLRTEYLLKCMFDRHPLGTRLKKNMQQNHEQLTDTGQLGEQGSRAERYCTFYETEASTLVHRTLVHQLA